MARAIYKIVVIFNIDLLFRWRHFCVVYDSRQENIEIFADTKLTFRKHDLQVVSESVFQDNLLNFITIGD